MEFNIGCQIGVITRSVIDNERGDKRVRVMIGSRSLDTDIESPGTSRPAPKAQRSSAASAAGG
jgi:hypothetical protein